MSDEPMLAQPARRMPTMSNPGCSQNRLSSTEMNAAGTCGGMRSSDTTLRFSIENSPTSSPSDE